MKGVCGCIGGGRLNSINKLCTILREEALDKPSLVFTWVQPRSQGLFILPPGRKMRDPGNEVDVRVDVGPLFWSGLCSRCAWVPKVNGLCWVTEQNFLQISLHAGQLGRLGNRRQHY